MKHSIQVYVLKVCFLLSPNTSIPMSLCCCCHAEVVCLSFSELKTCCHVYWSEFIYAVDYFQLLVGHVSECEAL